MERRYGLLLNRQTVAAKAPQAYFKEPSTQAEESIGRRDGLCHSSPQYRICFLKEPISTYQHLEAACSHSTQQPGLYSENPVQFTTVLVTWTCMYPTEYPQCTLDCLVHLQHRRECKPSISLPDNSEVVNFSQACPQITSKALHSRPITCT